MRMINTINKYLYHELGYKGEINYLDPDNSCINMVLESREGTTKQSSYVPINVPTLNLDVIDLHISPHESFVAFQKCS